MTHRLTTNYAKNYCNRTLIVKVIVENVVTCFLGGQGVVITVRPMSHMQQSRTTLCDYTVSQKKEAKLFLL